MLTSGATVGRPVRRRLFQVQNKRKPRRSQAMTVSGSTITSTARQSFETRERHIDEKRIHGRPQHQPWQREPHFQQAQARYPHVKIASTEDELTRLAAAGRGCRMTFSEPEVPMRTWIAVVSLALAAASLALAQT